MRKSLHSIFTTLGAGAILCAFWSVAPAAEGQKVFALVPKLVGVPFYADVEKGCMEEAKKINAKCLFIGPAQADEAEQVKFIRDLITKSVDGISIAPNNPESVASVIKAAQDKGIPVITFDSDAPKTSRTTFVGTNNFEGGVEGGKAFQAALPHGGKYAVITGGLAADNLNARIKGFKSALGGSFTEIAGSPFPCDDDSNKAVQLIQDILAKNSDIDGIFFSGGWPMFAPEAYSRALNKRHDDLKSGKFVIVSFDTLDVQLKLLKSGLATTLIGQRPYKMGTGSIQTLAKLSSKESAPGVIDTGVDVVDSKNVDSFQK
jgi:ribose transport system substrate-binding protein